jgi:hypothetical protein
MLTSDALQADSRSPVARARATRSDARAHTRPEAFAAPEPEASFSRLAALDGAVRAVAAATGAATRPAKPERSPLETASDEAQAWEELVASFSGSGLRTRPLGSDPHTTDHDSSAPASRGTGSGYEAEDAHAQIGRARAASARAAAAAREAEAARADLFELIVQPLAWNTPAQPLV